MGIPYRVVGEDGCQSLLGKWVHSPHPNNMVLPRTNHPTGRCVTNNMGHPALMTLDPEICPTITAVKHDKSPVLAPRHQNVLVGLPSRLDQ